MAEASLEPLCPPDTKPHVLFFIVPSLLSFKKITEVIAILYMLNCTHLPNSDPEVLAPSTSRWECIRNQGCYRCNEVRCGHTGVGWAPTQCDWCSYKREHWDTETDMHRQKMLGRDTESKPPPRRGEAQSRSLPHSPQKEPALPTP